MIFLERGIKNPTSSLLAPFKTDIEQALRAPRKDRSLSVHLTFYGNKRVLQEVKSPQSKKNKDPNPSPQMSRNKIQIFDLI